MNLVLIILVTVGFAEVASTNKKTELILTGPTKQVNTDYLASINNTYNIDSSLRTKIIGITIKNKIMNSSEKNSVDQLKTTVEKYYPLVQKQWSEELHKKFSKKELEYLHSVLNHDLFIRLKNFSRDFQISKENEERIIRELKTK